MKGRSVPERRVCEVEKVLNSMKVEVILIAVAMNIWWCLGADRISAESAIHGWGCAHKTNPKSPKPSPVTIKGICLSRVRRVSAASIR